MKEFLKRAAKALLPEEKKMEEVPIVAQATAEDNNTVLEALQVELTTLKSAFELAAEEVSALKAALKAEQELKAAALKQVHDNKMAARRSVVETNIGTEKADAFLAATEMLDDTAFKAVAQALAGSVELEASSAMFKEVGFDAKVDDVSKVDETSEMKLLKAKYAAKTAKANK